MNIFHRFTRRSLLKNRARTLVTLVGIMLSMALFTAVIQGANSGIQYLIRVQEFRTGAFHGLYYDLNEDEYEAAASQSGISSSTGWRIKGWADIGSGNEYKPYLLIKSIDENFTDLVAVDIISGRLPENENEIMLPAHLASNGGVIHQLGDELTLRVGERTAGGRPLAEKKPFDPENAETITHAQTINYTVTGFYSRFNYQVETYSSPGYTALTCGDADGSLGLFFTLDKPSQFYEYMNNNAVSSNWDSHRDLLMLHGTIYDNGLMQLLTGFAAILVFLIMFGSVSLIYNSFSISVSERTRQFGILKSVGATKKQIRASVTYEALLLCAIGIPLGALVGCAGIGTTLWCLRDSFSFLASSGRNVQMYLVISPVGLLAAAAICTTTVLISARTPARMALRASAIDSVRQSQDINIRRRDVRTRFITEKIFGFEGMLAAKNFGRNRRRYRSTIVSLFLSVTLFISASSFCAYLTDAVGGISTSLYNSDADIVYQPRVFTDLYSPDELLAMFKAEAVEGAAYSCNAYAYIGFDEASLTEDFAAYLRSQHVSDFGAGADISFVNDSAFRALMEKNGIDPSPFFDPENPMGAAANHVVYAEYLQDKERMRWLSFDILKESSLPVTGVQNRACVIDGYYFEGTAQNERGETVFVYQPGDPRTAGNVRNAADALYLTEEEAMVQLPFTIGALLDTRDFFIGGEGDFVIVYPCSMMPYVGGDELHSDLDAPGYSFIADDHWTAYDALYRVLAENGLGTSELYNRAESYEEERMLVTVINVFAYGFIILISLIAMANVFNTVSTGIALRRREFAMLRSVGLTGRSFDKMMIYECLIYGLRSLMLGLPAAFCLSYAIYRITDISFETRFYVPAGSVALAIGSVFTVVFITMLYAARKIRRDNPIDALKNENL